MRTVNEQFTETGALRRFKTAGAEKEILFFRKEHRAKVEHIRSAQKEEDLLFRIESETVSRGKKYMLMNLPKASLDEAIKILPAMRSPTVMPLASDDWCSLHSVIDSADLWTKVRQLKAIGAEGILVMDVDKIIL